jgi:hypothetical protein
MLGYFWKFIQYMLITSLGIAADCTAVPFSCQNSERLQVCRVRSQHEADVEFGNCDKLATMADSVEGLEIFILSGQSNMSGRGGVEIRTAKDGSTHREWDGVVPAEAAYEPGSVLRLNKGLQWEDAHEPLHADIDHGKEWALLWALPTPQTILFVEMDWELSHLVSNCESGRFLLLLLLLWIQWITWITLPLQLCFDY